MKQVESSLNLGLDLSLPRLLRPCLELGASLGEEAALADSGRERGGLGCLDRSSIFISGALRLFAYAVWDSAGRLSK